MKNENIRLTVGNIFVPSSCNKVEAKQVIDGPKNEGIVELPLIVNLPLDKKLYHISNPVKLIKSESFINKLFINEFSNFIPKKYKCMPQPDGIIYGDTEDNIDVLMEDILR
jgi:hypothetical protein